MDEDESDMKSLSEREEEVSKMRNTFVKSSKMMHNHSRHIRLTYLYDQHMNQIDDDHPDSSVSGESADEETKLV